MRSVGARRPFAILGTEAAFLPLPCRPSSGMVSFNDIPDPDRSIDPMEDGTVPTGGARTFESRPRAASMDGPMPRSPSGHGGMGPDVPDLRPKAYFYIVSCFQFIRESGP